MVDVRPATTLDVASADALSASFRHAYDDGGDWWSDEPARRLVAPILLDELTETPARVLDVGTGRGRDAAALLAAGHDVTGIDLVQTDEWRELCRRFPGRASFVAADARDLPERAAYDAILDNGCLHHQQPHDYRRLLVAFREALRPAGVLVVSLYLTPEPVGRLDLSADGRHSREFAYDEAVALLAQNGFAVTSTKRIPRSDPSKAYLVLVARPRLR